MKYLVLTPDFPPARGGVQTLVEVLARGLAASHEVRVLAPAMEGAAAVDRKAPYAVRRVDIRGGGPARKIWAWVAATRRGVAWADVVLCGHIAVSPAAWFWGWVYHTPYVIYVHALEITSRRRPGIRRFLMRRAAGVVTGSRYARGLVAECAGVPASRVVLVPPAVAPAMVARANAVQAPAALLKPDGKVLLSVARLRRDERYKGHDIVIRALPLIRRSVPGCLYWVVGGGDDGPRLRALARKMGVEDGVVFWGEVEDVTPFYRACDVFVMVSRRIRRDGLEKAEGFGLVYLEASLFGKPIVAGRVGGALDAVVDGETGVLVGPESPEEVAAAVVGILRSPDRGAALGTAGRARVLSSFTAARQAADVHKAVAYWMEGGRVRRNG